ncbi:MAG: 2-phosphosulfolactate phosphatase family protein [Cyanobacteriota bacterium]|nr:2-phosphosulfolactate phosphatase family protein [Cyanobacteriota bacterium]
MEVFIYHTPELTPPDSLPDCAVVIDVLRATSTIATALNNGAEAVQAFSSLTELMTHSEAWPETLRLRAGERGGAKVEGYDLGNSPLDCNPELMAGKRFFLSTTNGTRALQRVEAAPQVATAALLNRRAVTEFLALTQPQTLWLLGSGWEGGYSLEDTVCAGAVAELLAESCSYQIGNDEVIAARALFRQWQGDLLELLKQASHGRRLLGLNGDADIEYCASLDILNLVPIQKSPGVLIKK